MEEKFDSKKSSADKDKTKKNALGHNESENRNGSRVISSSDLGATSQPIADDADIFEQLQYAADRLKEYEERHGENRFASRINALWKFESSAAPSARPSNVELDMEELVSMERLHEVLEGSVLASALLAGLPDKKAEIIFDEQVQDISLKKNLIMLNPTLTLAEAAFLVTRELRRHYLSCDGNVLYPLAYEPDDAVLLHRVLEADCRAVAIWAAWEMKITGYKGVWDSLLSSNEVEMAYAFQKKAKEDFRHITSGRAARAAFDNFFGGALMVALDQRLIQAMLMDERGMVFGSKEPSIIVTPTLIEFIGELPTEKNYLVGTGEKPLSDSDYAAVKDRSNANFLWFVKFERSFQETERQFAEKEVREREEAAAPNKEANGQSNQDNVVSLAVEPEHKETGSQGVGKKRGKTSRKDQVGIKNADGRAQDEAGQVVYLFGNDAAEKILSGKPPHRDETE